MANEEWAPPPRWPSPRWAQSARAKLAARAALWTLVAALVSRPLAAVAPNDKQSPTAGEQDTTAVTPRAMAKDETDAQRRARLRLRVAAAYERAGRMADAEIAYIDAASEGSEDVRDDSVEALIRLIARRPPLTPDLHLTLGALHEAHGRLAEAEAAYTKAAESPSPPTRAQALQSLKRVLERRESILQAQVFPALRLVEQSVLVAVTTIILVAALYFTLSPLFRWFGRRRGKQTLSIGAFGSTSLASAVGGGFGELLVATHHRMAVHFRERIFLRNRELPALPALVKSQSSEFVDLMSAAAPFAGPFFGWFAQRAKQPAFRINGHVEVTLFAVAVSARLEHHGSTIRIWRESFPMMDWFERQQDLAYQIMLHLKEHADDAR